MRTRSPLLVLAAAVALAAPAVAADIEKPVRGKRVALTTEHGPWMIMAASFTAPPPDVRSEGMTPEQAADELVYELRSQGMPAYVYRTDDKIEEVQTVDRLGEPDKRIYAAQRGNVCVLAGNYSGPNDPKAKASLGWVKDFQPKFLHGGEADRVGMVSLKNGGVYRETVDAEGAPEGPLVGAFFTTNPLLTPEQVRSRNPERVTLLTKLNGGGDRSLLDNKAKYTIVVASFYGKTITVGGKASRKFDPASKPSDALDVAAQDAWELATHLRQLKQDAYVWHDEYKSVVTVGGFDRLDDPRIRDVVAKYGAKMKPHPQTKQPTLTAELLTIPTKPTLKDPIRKKWVFDPQPGVMARQGKLWGPLQQQQVAGR